MNVDTADPLRALSAKFLEHNKLSGPEVTEVEKLAIAALTEGSEGEQLVFSLASRLPPEAVAAALASRWSEWGEEARNGALAQLNKANETQRKRLLLQLSRAVARVSGGLARPLLVRACRLLAPSLDRAPNEKDQEMFRRVMLSGDGALFAFDFTGAAQAEIGALLSCVASEFAPSRQKSNSFSPVAPRLLTWVWKQGLYGRLGSSQQHAIIAAALAWPTSAREEFAKQFDPFPAEFAPLVPRSAAVASADASALVSGREDAASQKIAQQSTGEQVVVEPRPETTGGQERAPERPAAVAPQKAPARERILQFVTDLRDILSGEERLRDEARTQRAAAQAAREKANAAESALFRAEQTAREAVDQRDRECNARTAAEQQVETTRSEIAILRGELDAARSAHGREAEALAARAGVESARGIEAFKNGLSDQLRREWRHFDEVRDRSMSVDLGESLRRQLRGLFSILERTGFRFKD